MKTTNATRKLTKAGFRMVKAERFCQTWAIGGSAIELNLTDSTGMMGPDTIQDTVSSVRVRRLDEQDELISDYFAGSWMPNLTRAIDYTLERLAVSA